MGKNNAFINQMKMMAQINRAERYAEAADDVTPVLYASIALALHKTYSFGYERINKVFLESQNIWTDFKGKPDDMIKLCEEETGIRIEKRKL